MNYFREQTKLGRIIDANIEGRVKVENVSKEDLEEAEKAGVILEELTPDANK